MNYEKFEYFLVRTERDFDLLNAKIDLLQVGIDDLKVEKAKLDGKMIGASSVLSIVVSLIFNLLVVYWKSK